MLETALTAERTFTVPGQPITKGSLKCVGRNGRHQLIESNPQTREYLGAVAMAATSLGLALEPAQPVGVDLTCTLERPAFHHRSGRFAHLIREAAPRYPVRARSGDIDKLSRLVLDALQQAGVLADDAQVVELTARKLYPRHGPGALPRPGLVIRLYPIEQP